MTQFISTLYFPYGFQEAVVPPQENNEGNSQGDSCTTSLVDFKSRAEKKDKEFLEEIIQE